MGYYYNGRVLRITDAHAHIYPEKIAVKASAAIGDFYNIEIYPKYIMIMVIFILVCIYLFYRRNDKGNKIFRK